METNKKHVATDAIEGYRNLSWWQWVLLARQAEKSFDPFVGEQKLLLQSQGEIEIFGDAEFDKELQDTAKNFICAGAFDPATGEAVGHGFESVSKISKQEYLVSFKSPVTETYLVFMAAPGMRIACPQRTSAGFSIYLLHRGCSSHDVSAVEFFAIRA